MIRHYVFNNHVSSGHRRGHHKCSRFNSVRYYRVIGSFQTVDAVYLDGVRTGTLYIRTHGSKICGKVHYFRLNCRILNNCLAFRQNCGHHNIFRGTHTGKIQINLVSS